MNDSWIAIVDKRGLRQLVLETRHSLPFILKRASRENIECFWAVLTPQDVEFVEQIRRSGNTLSALRLLETLAIDAGRICPNGKSIPSWLTDDVTIPDGRGKEWSN